MQHAYAIPVQFAIVWLAFTACLTIGLDKLPAAPRPPNVIFLLADDLGYGDLGCQGHPYARTPNIDRLAREGTRFQQFNVTGVTCCPSRTGFMTSWFPARYATYPANGGFGERVTITELLKQAGYTTGHFGKWHIGPETKPGTYGIDVTPTDEQAHVPRRRDERGRDAHIYDAAIKFIEENQDRPFYVNVWGHIPHHPVNAPPAYLEKFAALSVKERDFPEVMQEKFATCRERGGDVSVAMRNYLGEIASLDDDVGRLLTRLDELALTGNTIVVFSSDHGSPAIPLPGKGQEGKAKKRGAAKAEATAEREEQRVNLMGYNGGLRGGKHGMYEGGVRVPLLIRWPGHVPAGRVDEKSAISAIDWLPTLCSIAGVKLSNAKVSAADFDGEDVSAAWLGQQTHVRAKPLFWKTSNPQADIGIRDGQWKLMHSARRRGEDELYDMTTDREERSNVAAQHPDVVKTLTAKIERWNATLPTSYIKTNDPDE